MRRRRVALLALLLALPLVVSAREKRFGYCQAQVTGARVKTCTVEVFVTGTLSHPSQLYADDIGTLLGNPFTASSSTGLWSFYADNGRYDVKFSGGSPTISPPYTLSDYLFLDIGTPGLATTFGGDVLPLFTNQGDVGNSTFTWGGGYFQNLTVTNALTLNAFTWSSGTSFTGALTHANTAARSYAFPDSSGTVPLLNAAQTWTGTNTFSVGQIFAQINSSNGSISSGGFINMSATDTVKIWDGFSSSLTLLSVFGGQPIVSGFQMSNGTITPATTPANIQIVAGNALGLTGYSATLQAGNALNLGGASHNGGVVNLIAGNGVNASGIGGSINLTPGTGTAGNGSVSISSGFLFYPPSVAFASLGTPVSGALVFCPDCTVASPCAGGGTGAMAKRLNSIWACN